MVSRLDIVKVEIVLTAVKIFRSPELASRIIWRVLVLKNAVLSITDAVNYKFEEKSGRICCRRTAALATVQRLSRSGSAESDTPARWAACRWRVGALAISPTCVMASRRRAVCAMA